MSPPKAHINEPKVIDSQAPQAPQSEVADLISVSFSVPQLIEVVRSWMLDPVNDPLARLVTFLNDIDAFDGNQSFYGLLVITELTSSKNPNYRAVKSVLEKHTNAIILLIRKGLAHAKNTSKSQKVAETMIKVKVFEIFIRVPILHS